MNIEVIRKDKLSCGTDSFIHWCEECGKKAEEIYYIKFHLKIGGVYDLNLCEDCLNNFIGEIQCKSLKATR
jgi:hypothetical protein